MLVLAALFGLLLPLQMAAITNVRSATGTARGFFAHRVWCAEPVDGQLVT
jgi:hypothetical protein